MLVAGRETRTKGVGGVTEASGEAQPQPVPMLAANLKWLFENVRRPNGKKHTPQEVADHVVQRFGGRCTREYITYLRSGATDNPTKRVIDGIADFFDISPAYFVDEERAREIQDQLNMAVMLRDDGVRAVALRAVTSALADGTRTGALSVEALNEVHELIMRRSAATTSATTNGATTDAIDSAAPPVAQPSAERDTGPEVNVRRQ